MRSVSPSAQMMRRFAVAFITVSTLVDRCGAFELPAVDRVTQMRVDGRLVRRETARLVEDNSAKQETAPSHSHESLAMAPEPDSAKDFEATVAACPKGPIGMLGDLHENAIKYFINSTKASPEYRAWMQHSDLFEVGVYTGISTCRKVKRFAQMGMPFRSVYGFDSFVGVPEADGQFKKGSWSAKAYARVGQLGDVNISQVVDKVKQNIDYPSTYLIQGFYNNSLTDELPQKNGDEQTILDQH